MILEKNNYYEILEVPQKAPQHEITKAYEQAKKTYSSDNTALYTVFTEQEARVLLEMIEEAYTVLGNAKYRARYDEKLNDPLTPPEELGFKSIVGQFVAPPADRSKAAFKPNYQVNHLVEEEIKKAENKDGPFIKKIREYKNISIEKMSEITKISSYYLSALEGNRYKDLPAPVFVRGFVTQVARVLGLDEKTLADSYMKLYKLHASQKK